MELVGLAASITTIADTSWKIFNYLEGVKHGGISRRMLRDELTLLWLVFKGLKDEIDMSNGKLADEPWVEPLKVLDGARGIAAQIQEQLRDLDGQLTATPGPFGEVMSTLRWPFQEKEAMRIVARMQELKQTTVLVIQQSNHRMNREIQQGICHIKSVVDDPFFEKLLLWHTHQLSAKAARDPRHR